MAQVTLDELNRMDEAAFVSALGDIFEYSPWIPETAYGHRPFTTVRDLQQALSGAVFGAAGERQSALIKAHPDLAGKAALEGTITADSKFEQTSAGLDRLTETEFASFQRLNTLYREKFGMPFVVCVRRHGKDSILRQFEHRLQNDEATERHSALAEILRIAALRLAQRVSGPDRLEVHGRLSTHVLDNHRGCPAAGVEIEFIEVTKSGQRRSILRTVTNSDGRTDRPIVADQPVPIAQYELRFAVGDYFARIGTATAEPPFLDVVPVRFSVAEPEGHYHVPLLVTPWSYATYKGS
jgi:2-oxo-4-hydroxy-4-carboxy-5-ureidoimidazoline decarboxylase